MLGRVCVVFLQAEAARRSWRERAGSSEHRDTQSSPRCLVQRLRANKGCFRFAIEEIVVPVQASQSLMSERIFRRQKTTLENIKNREDESVGQREDQVSCPSRFPLSLLNLLARVADTGALDTMWCFLSISE